MKYNYLAIGNEMQTDEFSGGDGKKITTPVTIKIEIVVDKRKYESIKNKYTEHIFYKFLKFFK